MNKLAVIDVGTNSAKITVLESENGTAGAILLDASEITRLGEGVDAARNLNAAAMNRTAEVVQGFVERANALGVASIRIVGTSALRDAANRGEFIDLVRSKTRVTLEVIDGEREAALAFAAVRADPKVSSQLHGQLLVFDIGGGSTELILGQGLSPEQKVSLNLGAVRLTERFIKSDPPALSDIEEASAEIGLQFAQAAWIGAPGLSAGIGGTVVTLAAVVHKSDFDDVEALHGLTLSMEDIESALHRFTSVTLQERRKIVGLNPKRADIIVCGTLILRALLKTCGLSGFIVSTRGLRFGLLAEMAEAA